MHINAQQKTEKEKEERITQTQQMHVWFWQKTREK